MGEMKMGNIVSKVGSESTSLASQASVLPLCHVDSLMSALCPCLPVYAASCLRGQCRLIHSSHCNYKSFTSYDYIHRGSGLIYTYTGQVQQPNSGQLVQDPGHGNQSCACDENWKYCAQSGNRTHISGIPVRALPLHHVCAQMSPIYAFLPVYAGLLFWEIGEFEDHGFEFRACRF